MARSKEPIALIIKKGKKHLTKSEIAQRSSSEVKPIATDIRPPSYLTAKQKKYFLEIAGQLTKLGVIGDTDIDALARYVTAEELYRQAVKDIRSAQKTQPDSSDLQAFTDWAAMMDKLDKRQERYFRQAHTCASALGLTITSRCKLVIPQKEEEKKQNRFAQFDKAVNEK